MFTTGFAFWKKIAQLVFETFGPPYYIGGGFTTYKRITANYAIQLNEDGSEDVSFGNGFNSTIRDIKFQTDGKILICGAFSSYRLVSANRIVRLNTDLSRDTSFIPSPGAGLNGTANTIEIQGDGKILIGGIFTAFDSVTTNRIIRLNTDGTRDTSFNIGSGFNNSVEDMAIQSDGKIIVAGTFTTYQGVTENRIIRLNTDGSKDTSFVIGTGFNSTVNTIDIDASGSILAAGDYLTYQGISVVRVIRLLTNGSRDTSFDILGGINGTPRKILVQPDGKILIGGGFTLLQGFSTNRIARLNTNGSRDTSFIVGSGFNNTVQAISIDGTNRILAGGDFTTYQGVTENRIIRLNTDGSRDTSFVTRTGLANNALVININSVGKIIAAGNFTSYQGDTVSRFAKLDNNAEIDTSFIVAPGFNSNVFGVAIQSNGRIIVGGVFTSYKNLSNFNSRIIRLYPNGNKDTSFLTLSGFNNTVNVIVIDNNGKIIVGGGFTTYQGVTANRIIRLNTDGSIDTSFNTGTGFDGSVLAIDIDANGKIIACGTFAQNNGVSVGRIDRLNTDGSRDTSFNTGSGVNTTAETIKIQPNGMILVGGAFTTYNGVSAVRIVRLNTDGTRDTSFNTGSGFNSTVETISIDSTNKILAAGSFTTYNGVSANYIIRLNADGSIDTSFNTGTGFSGTVNNIKIQSDGKIIAAGFFATYQGITANRIIRLNTDGSKDTSFAVGVGFNSAPDIIGLSDSTLNLSILPTYSILPNKTTVLENNDSVIFTINTTNEQNQTMYYTILGINNSNITSSDFVGNSLSGQFQLTNNSGTFTIVPSADVTTEGDEQFIVLLRTGSIDGPIVASTELPITISDTSEAPVPIPSFVTSTNKLPIFGTGGAATHPPSGWTSLQNSSADDAFVTFSTSFNFTINNTNYTAHNIGSNTYITWGGGSTQFSSLSASSPALNKLFLGAADNSYQRVSRLQVSNYTRVRYEGNQATSGTVGSPGIVLEVTIFNPADYGGQQVIEVLVGNHGRTAGQAGIASTSTYYRQWTMQVNTSFVLVGNSTGTIWNRHLGHVNNSGY